MATKDGNPNGAVQNGKIVAEQYDKWGDEYEEITYKKWKYTIPELVLELLPQYISVDDRNVLDAGCGTGGMGSLLREKYSKVKLTGIDVSNKMLELAKQKGCYQDLYRVDFEHAFPVIDSNGLDLVLCLGVTSYLTPSMPFLSEFGRVLKSGGILVITFRDDLYDPWEESMRDMEKGWKLLEMKSGLDYLPGNVQFGSQITCRYLVFEKR